MRKLNELYDEKVLELAAFFISEAKGFANCQEREIATHQLAIKIQQTIEDFLIGG